MATADDTGADALARRMASLHLGLAHARDELELLDAVARALLPYAPFVVDLHYLDIDDHGDPVETWPVALWTPQRPASPHAYRDHRVRLASNPLSDHWIAAPEQPLVITDVNTDPRVDDALRGMLSGRRAIIVLPLRSAHPRRWQGIVTLHWIDPHTPGEEEQLVYRLLMHTLAGCIADRRALAAHTAALAEIQALYRLSTRINESADPAELLASVVGEARLPGAHGKLLTIETGPSGQPRTLRIIAVHGGDQAALASLGTTFAVADTPSAHLWIDRPDEVMMIGDLAADPRLDAAARAIHLGPGLAAMILLPLRWQGRWLGLLQLGWDRPRSFDEDERRLYESIAPQAAAVLDNRLLVERSAQAVADSKQQARTLEIVLEHLPIGVMIIDAASGKRTTNRAGTELLTDEEPDLRQPLPLYHPDSDRPVGPEERLSRRVLLSGEVISTDRDLLDHDGVRRRLTVTAAPFRDPDGGAILGTITLFHDITQHVTAERERHELKDAVIAAQDAALAERATPLIPISAEVVVVPIVGAVDPERGRQLIRTLLELAGHPEARVVIVDLTGVRQLGSEGAAALVQSVAALRLRGVAAILTGIRDDIAWTLVERHDDLRGLRTCTTLQDGLALAARLLRGA